MLERAIAVIEREMAGGASFAQVKGAAGLVQAMQAMVSAEQMSVADGKKLTALFQTQNDAKDSEAAFGAPAAAVYESSSGGIADTLQGLLHTATEQLESARKTEVTSKQNFEMKTQSLTDEVKYANKDLDEAKKSSSANAEKQATAEGDLSVTTKALNEDKAALASLHAECMQKASAYESETSSRGEELKALATAKKIIKEATSLAQTSFVQLVSSTKGNKIVHVLKDLASAQHSTALSQLASRVQSAIRLGNSAGDDPFAKVKQLITDMLAKLTKEAEEAATQKAFCDKEMAETKAKCDDKTAEVEKLSTRVEQKEAVYKVTQPELEKAVAGIQLALKTLKDYYAKAAEHGASEGAGNGIISLLEVAEADFTKNLNEVVVEEQMAAASHKAQTKENGFTKLTKEADVKYKNKEAASLDKAVSETKTDLQGVQDELDAVNSAWASLKSQCVAVPETYEERKARREAEVNGLKEALEILESEAALVQVSARHLRGVKQHA